MKKSQLETGMVVETKGGSKWVVSKGCLFGDFLLKEDGCSHNGLNYYSDDLKYEGNVYGYEIIRVLSVQNTYASNLLRPSNFNKLIMESTKVLWESVSVDEMTLQEVCKELGREIKIVKG